MYRNALPHIVEKQSLAGARGPWAHFEAIQKIRARMSDIDRENIDRQEAIIKTTRQLRSTGNLTENEIEEFNNIEFGSGAMSFKEQLRRYYLMVKRDNPDLASKFKIELDKEMENSVNNDSDLSIVNIIFILKKYVHGFVIIYNDLSYFISEGELKITGRLDMS